MRGATKESWIKRKANGNGTPWNKGKPSPSFRGENNPKWKGGEIKLTCVECLSSFSVRQYRKNTARFCSHKCASDNRNEGKRTAQKVIRQSWAYRKWREGVFERDDYTCQECGIRNGKGLGKTVVMRADHKFPFAHFPELRLDISNGQTLCDECHRKTGTFGLGANRLLGYEESVCPTYLIA